MESDQSPDSRNPLGSELRNGVELPVQISPSIPRVQPWIRYWARTIDNGALGFLIVVCLGLLYPKFLELSAILLNMMVLTIWIPLEAAFLTIWGTTPGKLILNIELKQSGAERITYGKALFRSFDVWLRGLGVGIPFISLFTLYHSFERLKKNQIASWDADEGFTVTHHEINFGRALLATVLLVSIYATYIAEKAGLFD